MDWLALVFGLALLGGLLGAMRSVSLRFRSGAGLPGRHTGPRDPGSVSYRTRDGTADYCFRFEQRGYSDWRAWIVCAPRYGSRDASNHATHRLYDGDRPYVCWTTPLASEADAQSVARQWAECTHAYILYGRRF